MGPVPMEAQLMLSIEYLNKQHLTQNLNKTLCIKYLNSFNQNVHKLQKKKKHTRAGESLSWREYANYKYKLDYIVLHLLKHWAQITAVLQR